MNRVGPAQFIRWVSSAETTADLVEEAKALTWQWEAEHALLRNDSLQRLLVRGGRDGISFSWDAKLQALRMNQQSLIITIVEICWHTHPRVTGPSDGDLEALVLLQQQDSVIYEIGGDRDGTRIRPKS